jgi:hypothetical protein
MPMIGGELAAVAALAGRRVAAGGDRQPAYDLGWVADWLYGDASLPPMPLPPREPAHPPHAPVHAEAPVHAPAPAPPTPARRRSPARRRARQLVLL